MKKATFLNTERPLIVSMVQGRTPERIEELMELSRRDGAEAFGMQFETVDPVYRTREVTERLLAKAASQPVYVTNYRSHENKGRKTEDQLAAELLELAECGATLCDVMGDYFDPCEGELTMNEEAVQKQMRLIDELHARGAEVLMSSHILKFTPAERVLQVAMEHQRRGADICKIVSGASTVEEQIENLRIIRLLKETLRIPFLFLCGGKCHLLRRVGATLGSCMSLCVYEHDDMATKSQPLVSDMKAIRDYMGEEKHS